MLNERQKLCGVNCHGMTGTEKIKGKNLSGSWKALSVTDWKTRAYASTDI
jgi:hypothetical protein